MSDTATKSQEQKSAEAEVKGFEDGLGPFVIATQTTRMPMLFVDGGEDGLPIVFANDSFLRLTGYDRDEVLAQSFSSILGPTADDEAIRQIEAAFVDPATKLPEIPFRRKDGSLCWVSLFVNPVKDTQGVVVQHFVSFHDTTQYRTAEHNAQLLIEELNHRVKNTLATVQSIVSQAVRSSQEPAQIRASLEVRIAALSRSHDLLSRAKWEAVSLRDLILAALAPFRGADHHADPVTIEGTDVRLTPKTALALGIAINELAANAIKFGALSTAEGKVAVRWTIDERPRGSWLDLRWEEQGGPPVTLPHHKGFGSRVIEQGLAHELGGEVRLDYRTSGVACSIAIPLRHGVRS